MAKPKATPRSWMVLVASIGMVAVVALVVSVLVVRAASSPQRDSAAATSSRSSDSASSPRPSSGSGVGGGSSSQPAQSATGKANVDQAEEFERYRINVAAINQQIATQMDGLTAHLVRTDYQSEQWVSEVSEILSEMGKTARSARAIVPPDRYRQAHVEWQRGIDSYEWVAVNMASAIETADDARMLECTKRMEQASSEFKSAATLLAQ